MKLTDKTFNRILKVGGITAAGIAIFIVLKKLGIFKSAVEREGEKNIAETTTQLTIKKNNTTLSEAELRAIASSIKNSWGVFNDDEEKIYNSFARLGSYDDLMFVFRYYGTYGRNNEGLEDSINNRLSEREKQKINEILSKNGINFNF